MEKRIAVIGNGAMTFDCIKTLNENINASVLLVISNPMFTAPSLNKRLTKYCSTSSITYISTKELNTEHIEKTLRDLKLDYIFNIDSFTIIKPQIFNLPKNGVVNFHNSPLPHYRGANAPSWAIINGESKFGVTWHFMDEKVDTGDILWQKNFDIRENETARTLIFKCIEEGIKLFKDNISDLLSDNLSTSKQTDNGRTYYRKNTPNRGYIDIEWDARKIDCFVRGLNFRPFENKFIYAKLKLENNEFVVNKIRTISKINESSPAPGTVLGISSEGIEILCGDNVILIEEISDLDGKALEFNSLDLSKHIYSNNETKNVA